MPTRSLNSDLQNKVLIASKNTFRIKSGTDRTDVTAIDKSSATSIYNAPCLVHQVSGTILTGMPSSETAGFVGIRTVHFYDVNNIVIELLSLNAPFKTYYRKYNGSSWGDWYYTAATKVS
jgi:hypothetical protein